LRIEQHYKEAENAVLFSVEQLELLSSAFQKLFSFPRPGGADIPELRCAFEHHWWEAQSLPWRGSLQWFDKVAATPTCC